MKSICFCNTTTAWGGGEKWHLEAATALAERGWKVFLVCGKNSVLHQRALLNPAITVFPVAGGKLSFLNPIKIQKAASFLKKLAVDSIILNLPADLKHFGMAAKLAGIPQIIYRRGSDIPIRNTWFNRYLYQHVLTHVIANSQATKQSIFANNPQLLEESNVSVIYNGIDIALFDSFLENRKCLPGVNKNKGIVIGNAGRLNKQKAQHYLLYLGKALQEKNIPFQLVIAGEGDRKEELQNLAKKLGVARHVLFTGFLDDLSPFWHSIDIFYLPSLWEGFGFVLVEAMLARKPVLAFNVSNIPELIRDGENGFIFPLHGPGTMEKEVEAVADLAANRQLMIKMGNKGRTFAEANFSLSSSMNALEALLSAR